MSTPPRGYFNRTLKVNLESKKVDYFTHYEQPESMGNGEFSLQFDETNKIFTYKDNYFYSTPIPRPTSEKYSNLVGHQIVDGLFFGGSEQKMVVLEKRGDKSDELSRFAFYPTQIEKSFYKIEKLDGGYLAIKAKVHRKVGARILRSYQVLDIWAP